MAKEKVHLEFKNEDVPAHKIISINGGGVLEAGKEAEIILGEKAEKYEIPEGKKLVFSVHLSGTLLDAD